FRLAGRLTAGTMALLIGLAALGFVLALLTGYVEVVTLSQQLHLDGAGLVTVFLLNLAFLPTLIVWSLAWFVGPGFAIGAGSSVSPFGTQLGPVPSLPIFGALPDGWGSLGLIAPILVVLCALIAALLLLGTGARPSGQRSRWGWPGTAPGARDAAADADPARSAAAEPSGAAASGTNTDPGTEPDPASNTDPATDTEQEARDDAQPGDGDPVADPAAEPLFGGLPDAADAETREAAAAFPTLAVLIAVPLAALVVGVIVWLLGLAASGGFGPGRLAVAGPDALLVAGTAALEVLIGATLGALIVRVDWSDRLKRSRRRLAGLPEALAAA
ncbi:cell division protein PerM, partial [Leucobacter sp. M11]|uniref:cell division protein PerM n=1 Tax=Leucobacter sp. M11 TaxID=2993565 RepID=UPI002D7E7D9C